MARHELMPGKTGNHLTNSGPMEATELPKKQPPFYLNRQVMRALLRS